MDWWEWFHQPIFKPRTEQIKRDVNDISTWGPECQRGLNYVTTGAPTAAGTPGQVRKFSSGRKERGYASGDPRKDGAA